MLRKPIRFSRLFLFCLLRKLSFKNILLLIYLLEFLGWGLRIHIFGKLPDRPVTNETFPQNSVNLWAWVLVCRVLECSGPYSASWSLVKSFLVVFFIPSIPCLGRLLAFIWVLFSGMHSLLWIRYTSGLFLAPPHHGREGGQNVLSKW